MNRRAFSGYIADAKFDNMSCLAWHRVEGTNPERNCYSGGVHGDEHLWSWLGELHQATADRRRRGDCPHEPVATDWLGAHPATSEEAGGESKR
jgi:hypothetical protein